MRIRDLRLGGTYYGKISGERKIMEWAGISSFAGANLTYEEILDGHNMPSGAIKTCSAAAFARWAEEECEARP